MDTSTYTYGETAIYEESDMNWETRMMLEEICASVNNVIEDAERDFASLDSFDLLAA